MLVRSFEQVINDERIDEIIIQDDYSNDGSYAKICTKFIENDKVKIFRNEYNLGMSRNKAEAINNANNKWCILFDSDNILGKDYLDVLEKFYPEYPENIYAPEKALPTFIYSEFVNRVISRKNIAEFIPKQFFGALINTCNYVVHRDTYMKNYLHNPQIKGTDTAWHFYNHLKNGGKFYVVKGLQYEHTVHPESTFMQDVHYNMAKAVEIENLLKEL